MQQTLKLYRAYCILNVIWYVVVGGLGVAGILLAKSADPELLPPDQGQILRLCGIILILIAVVFGTATVKLMQLPRTPTTYTAHFVNICLGLTTCLLTPLCLYLAIQWQKPELRAHFEQESFKL